MSPAEKERLRIEEFERRLAAALRRILREEKERHANREGGKHNVGH